MTTFKKENWDKSTPKKWRDVGDALLVIGAGVSSVAAILPMPPTVKVLVVVASTIITTAGKFLTKLFSDD